MENNQIVTGLVSIAIPAYKVSYFAEAIESALSQDYRNIELIIVNDASPYNLDAVMNRYPDSRIRYYKNEENLGRRSIVLNWNKCLSLAKGEYFVLLCDDDVLMPNFVSELLKLAEKYPFCNVFHARKINMYPDGHQEESPVWPEYEDGETFLRKSLDKQRHHTVTEFMYRTTFFQEKGYVNFPVGFYSDRATVMELCQEGGIVSTQECIVRFRFSNDHITSSKDSFYSIEKVKASLAYWGWIHQIKSWTKEYERQIREDVQSTIYGAFICSSMKQKFKILYMVPNHIANIKIKFGYILKTLF